MTAFHYYLLVREFGLLLQVAGFTALLKIVPIFNGNQKTNRKPRKIRRTIWKPERHAFFLIRLKIKRSQKKPKTANFKRKTACPLFGMQGINCFFFSPQF